jgi:hypothetical protein
MLLRTYNSSEYVAKIYGDIWSVASDGDVVRSRALHQLCMCHMLSPSDPLFNLLGNLPRMNLQCGKKNVTANFDYKHKIKSMYITCLSVKNIIMNLLPQIQLPCFMVRVES